MNSFALKIDGETKMGQEQLETALHNFLQQHDLIQCESGDVYVVHVNNVSVTEYEEDE